MKYNAGTPVRSIDNPGREGVTTNTPPRKKPSGMWFQVKWSDGCVDYAHEEEIEALDNLDLQDPFALITQKRYGRAADLRRNLTYVHLSGKLANLVYAMGITNTEFYAHQYRPLLTLLDSPANGLLIADEVGLGKTIEAGLIWTELRARFDMRRLVVVCPAMLREKWRDELRNRFGVDATLVKAEELLDVLKQPKLQLSDGKAWIISYQAARPPRDWQPHKKNPPKNPSTRWRLADFLYANIEDDPLIDMIIFDEAHYMRNQESTAWRLGDILCQTSDYQIMLSATPINLRNRDLFNLLRLIDPENFGYEEDFQRLVNANKPLILARDAILNQKSNAEEIINYLNGVANEPMLSRSSQIKELIKEIPTNEKLASKSYRASLADTLEKVNLLSHVITRTRKRDVQINKVIREVRRESVEMSSAEREFYSAVTILVRDYAWEKSISDGFLLATPQRQVTSCPAAIAEAWLKGGDAIKELEEDAFLEYDNEDEVDYSSVSLSETLKLKLPKTINAIELRNNDTKFTRLTKVVTEFFNKNPSEKIILFTTFRATARYLTDRLIKTGIHTALLWGGQTQSKQEIIDNFRKDMKARILVSTEVAAEGVDLQFCRVLINYDLPWNPTRIEQRIGRIDRLGQKSNIIHIWNLYFQDTIDARIINRLLERLHIFEEALGESEAVVGEEIRRLESELLSRPLTKEEEDEKIEKSAQALENLRLQREEMEKNSAHMMAHGQRILERIEAAKELSHRITEDDLYIYVKDYLSKYSTGHRFSQEGQNSYIVNIQLSAELAARLADFLHSEGLFGKTLLASGENKICYFLNRISGSTQKGMEIIHQFHPLIRFISYDLKLRSENFYPLVAIQIDNEEEEENNIDHGVYVFYIRSWSFIGVREEELLATSIIRFDDGRELDEDGADKLLQLARTKGKDWLGSEHLIDTNLVTTRMETVESILDDRYHVILARKKNENADRARFQLDSINRYVENRLPKLRQIYHSHIALGRQSLAKATQGKIDKLSAKMNTRKERINEQEKIRADRYFICAGIINVK